jgi:hypothetical protein
LPFVVAFLKDFLLCGAIGLFTISPPIDFEHDRAGQQTKQHWVNFYLVFFFLFPRVVPATTLQIE